MVSFIGENRNVKNQRSVMKKLLFFIGIVFISTTAQSQILITLLFGDKLNSDRMEFGLEGGLNFSNISGFENDAYLSKFNLGFYFDIRMKNNLYLHTGVQGISSLGMSGLSDKDVEMLNSSVLENPGDYSQVIKSFYVPALAQYRFKNHIYVEVGPKVGLQYESFVNYKSDHDNKDVYIKDYNNDLLNWFDTGIALGTGYKLLEGQGWSIGARYYQGFTNVFKDISGSKNRSFYIICKIPIGAKPPKEK